MNVGPYGFGVRIVGVVILTEAALAGAVGVAIAKHITTSPRLQFKLRTLLLLVAMCLGGVVGGTLWAMVPAFLKVRVRMNEIISTLAMRNERL